MSAQSKVFSPILTTRRRPAVAAALLATLGALQTNVHAQTSATADPASDASPAAGAPPAAPPAQQQFAAPAVHDPMLAPPLPPARVLQTWREALQLIRATNTRGQVARARVVQARGQARRAFAPALPTITGAGALTHHLLRGEGARLTDDGFTTSQLPEPPTLLTATLALRVPLLALQSWHDYGTSKTNVRRAELERVDSEREILASTADAIVRVVSSERLAEVSRIALRSALEMRTLHQRRFALGGATAFDVLRADQEVAASRAQVVAADETLRQAREDLALELGSNQSYGVAPTIALDGIVADAAQLCRRIGKAAARADVQARALGVEVAERDVTSATLSRLPRIDGTSDVTWYEDPRWSPNQEHTTWTIGAVLTWQLYDGGAAYGDRTLSRGRMMEAKAELQARQREVDVEVARAQRNVRVAAANLRVAEESRAVARESDRLARLAFTNGGGTSFDVVDAARRLRETELDLTIKEFELVRARITAVLAQANCAPQR